MPMWPNRNNVVCEALASQLYLFLAPMIFGCIHKQVFINVQIILLYPIFPISTLQGLP